MSNEDGFDDLLVFRADECQGYACFLFRSLRDLLWVDKQIDVLSNGGVHLHRFASTEFRERIQLMHDQFQDVFARSREELLVPSSDQATVLNKMIASINEQARTTFFYWSAFDASTRKEIWRMRRIPECPIPIVFIRPEHRELFLGDSGWSAFRAMVSDPLAHGGERIGSGSEGLVYHVSWLGREYAVKVVNEEAQREFDEFSKRRGLGHMTPHFSRPEFLQRAGFMERVMEVIRDIPDLPFDLHGVQDFAFGHDFQVTEFVPNAKTLDDLAPRKGEPDESARAFLQAHGITPNQLQSAKRTLEEIDRLLALVRQSTFFKDFRLNSDTHPNNILVCGVDAETGRLQLRLIDQGQEPPSYSDSLGILDDYYADQAFEDARSLFENLVSRSNGHYDKFTAKYFPTGFPEKRVNT